MTDRQKQKYEDQKVTFEEWQKRLDVKTDNEFVLLEIIDTVYAKLFKAECKVCKKSYEGNVARLQPSCLKKKHHCTICHEQQLRIKQKQLNEENKLYKKIFKSFINTYLPKHNVQLKHCKVRTITCNYCGNDFTVLGIHGNRKTCDDCKILFSKKDKRLHAMLSRPHDNDITIKKLFERDKGICYLCGGNCDWNSKHVSSNGTIVVDSYYPTIDHVIPLSKDGTHQWKNVRLAHFICNTAKGAKVER